MRWRGERIRRWGEGGCKGTAAGGKGGGRRGRGGSEEFGVNMAA